MIYFPLSSIQLYLRFLLTVVKISCVLFSSHPGQFLRKREQYVGLHPEKEINIAGACFISEIYG